jgi:hypothetical protein
MARPYCAAELDATASTYTARVDVDVRSFWSVTTYSIASVPCDRTEPAGLPTGNRTAHQIMSWSGATREGNMAEDQWVVMEEPEPSEQQKLFEETHKRSMELVRRIEHMMLTILKRR